MSIQAETTADINTVFPEVTREERRRLKLHKRLSSLVGLYKLSLTGFLAMTAYILVMFLIYLGWQNRMEQPLSAESGLGYALGIVGGSLMLLLLLYPLRKHARFMRRLGPVKYWFRTHMVFGIVGPVLILFHSGFSLGSLNSNVALICMLLVASSGLVGRYFYTRIHHGLYGRKASLEELKIHSAILKSALSRELHLAPWALSKIYLFEKHAQDLPRNLITSFWKLLSLGIRTWSLYSYFRIFTLFKPLTIKTRTKTGKAISNKKIIRHIGAHLSSIRKVAGFHFYERLFSIWHVLHYPLYLMLIVSGIIHVVAVHMY